MKNKEEQLEIAIGIALKAHAGQRDKGGNPHILHPLRVMNAVENLDEEIVAILHDVVEDSEYSFEDLLKEGIEPRLVDSLKLLTHKKDVDYFVYIDQIAQNELSKQVKLVDLYDNSNLSRIPNSTEKNLNRVQKYAKAISILESCNKIPK